MSRALMMEMRDDEDDEDGWDERAEADERNDEEELAWAIWIDVDSEKVAYETGDDMTRAAVILWGLKVIKSDNTNIKYKSTPRKLNTLSFSTTTFCLVDVLSIPNLDAQWATFRV